MFALEDVHKSYRMGETEVHALRGVSLEVAPGRMTAVMGPSGSGKSTLLHLIGALDVPTAGRVTFEGRNLSALSSRERADFRATEVGFVFQKFNLLPNLTALENVFLPLLLRGASVASARERGARALDAVSLQDRKDHRPARLSGGEQQRVAIARALVREPGTILADEPTGNLDTETGKRILNLLRELTDRGKTLVVVTHDADVAELADVRVRLRDGKLEASPAAVA
ncbi:MAG: ABC transporter ATP-binding protein [Thermotogota bacterium]